MHTQTGCFSSTLYRKVNAKISELNIELLFFQAGSTDRFQHFDPYIYGALKAGERNIHLKQAI